MLSFRYQNIVANVEKKTYDMLDQRKTEFEGDYEEFKGQVSNLEAALQSYMDGWFSKSLTTEYLLILLGKFSTIRGVKYVYLIEYS